MPTLPTTSYFNDTLMSQDQVVSSFTSHFTPSSETLNSLMENNSTHPLKRADTITQTFISIPKLPNTHTNSPTSAFNSFQPPKDEVKIAKELIPPFNETLQSIFLTASLTSMLALGCLYLASKYFLKKRSSVKKK